MIIALVLGTLLAVGALGFVLYPIFFGVARPAAPAVVAAPVAEPVVEPVAPAAAPTPAPVYTAAPLAAEPVQASTLHGIVNAAGLTWVETDPARHAQTQQRIAASLVSVRLGRERKPVAPVSSAPLQQVETRR